MAILNDRALLIKITDAVAEANGYTSFQVASKPFEMMVYGEDFAIETIIYIWNLTYGGYPRNSSEYRIQVKVREPLKNRLSAKTLILGWSDDFGVFAGFDYTKHLAPKYSSSLQVVESTLRDAFVNGLAFQDKGNQEIAVAFRPDFLLYYIQNVEALHLLGETPEVLDISRSIPPQLMQESIINFADTDNSVEINPERKTTLITVTKKVRDTYFRRRVLTAYEHRCAVCGIQLNLIDAAHILPVSHPASTDKTSNGICLCALHHRAYDHALITFDADYYIHVNQAKLTPLKEIRQGDGEEKFVADLRKILLIPPNINDRPQSTYIQLANQLRGWI
jgi:putative restriction endonuclease